MFLGPWIEGGSRFFPAMIIGDLGPFMKGIVTVLFGGTRLESQTTHLPLAEI